MCVCVVVCVCWVCDINLLVCMNTVYVGMHTSVIMSMCVCVCDYVYMYVWGTIYKCDSFLPHFSHTHSPLPLHIAHNSSFPSLSPPSLSPFFASSLPPSIHPLLPLSLSDELQNTFDIFHRCLAVAYGTFFLNLYTKANAPCLLCHGCKSLYPPGQYIHHACPALPPNIVPCRSRMWRRCLVPLVSQVCCYMLCVCVFTW